MPRQYQPADEATKKRLEEMRLKGLETRKMKAELKKAEKEQQKAELKKAYEERVLKKKPEPQPAKIEETDKEVYPSATHADETEAEESDEEPVPVKPVKAKKQPKAQTLSQPPATNYKQEYYKLKMMKLQEQDEQSRFMESYERMPPTVHVADVARQQLKSKVNDELMKRVYNDLFGVH